MDELKFSAKWNTIDGNSSKIDLKNFSTIRLDQEKYQLGKWVKVVLSGSPKEYPAAKIVYRKSFYLHEMTEYVARLDTGYGKEDAEKIIRNFYPNINFFEKKLVLLILEYPTFKS